MCVIAVSRKGIKQPTMEQLRNMYDNNPDGAGYMFARDGKVFIHKGFMTWEDFSRNVKAEHFTKNDSVVYHFRIATQAGVNPEMTHPFPLTHYIENCKWLDVECTYGVAHNGIIRMTSDSKEKEYSDTAIFIAEYLSKLIRCPEDMNDPAILEMVDYLTNSKWAIMNVDGEISTVGNFQNADGILFSNGSYLPRKTTIVKPFKFDYEDYMLGYYGVKCN